MPVPDFTPYEGLLPSEADPATFPARAEALMAWFTQTGAPQLAALSVFMADLMDDESTVLDALDSLQASLGSAAQQAFTDDDDLAVDPGHVGTRGNAASAITAAIAATVESSLLGHNQAWQDVSTERAVGTAYQNTTGRPIQWSANNSSGEQQVSADGVTWVRVDVGASSSRQATAVIVPNGHFYRIQGGSGTIDIWSELR